MLVNCQVEGGADETRAATALTSLPPFSSEIRFLRSDLGNRRERIFADEKDCLRFVALLKESLRRYEVEIDAYVLLPNHFHLLAGLR